MPRTARPLTPAEQARKLAEQLGIRPTGVTVAPDGTVTLFDASGHSVQMRAHERQSKADAALKQWEEQERAA